MRPVSMTVAGWVESEIRPQPGSSCVPSVTCWSLVSGLARTPNRASFSRRGMKAGSYCLCGCGF